MDLGSIGTNKNGTNWGKEGKINDDNGPIYKDNRIDIASNIILGEIHKGSGLEGSTEDVDLQVKEWLTSKEFQNFASRMRLISNNDDDANLSNVTKYLENMHNIRDIENEGFLDDLIGKDIEEEEEEDDTDGVRASFYAGWSPNNAESGHATNVSLTKRDDGTWEVTIHNIGFGASVENGPNKDEGVRKNSEETLCPGAYIFTNLTNKQVKQVLKSINYLQSSADKNTYETRFKEICKGELTYTEIGDKNEEKKVDIFQNNICKLKHNSLFIRAQTAGNCTYASLNAMMYYLILNEYGVRDVSVSEPSYKFASWSARVVDFYCRMKSMGAMFHNETAYIENNPKEPSNRQRIRYLERLLNANSNYFNSKVKKHYGRKLAEKDEKLGGTKLSQDIRAAEKEFEKINEDLEIYRTELSKIVEFVNKSNLLPDEALPKINTEGLNNSGEIQATLPSPKEETTVLEPLKIDEYDGLPELENQIRDIEVSLASNSPQATWGALPKIGTFCKNFLNSEFAKTAGNEAIENNRKLIVNYVGNKVRSLILSEKFQVDISSALKTANLSIESLNSLMQITNFFHNVKTIDKGSIHDATKLQEFDSIDEQNIFLTLQAHSLQIYRELVKRRNDALTQGAPHYKDIKGNSYLTSHIGELIFNPNELIISVPEIKDTDHCYDKRSIDRRNELRKFSTGSGFVVGSKNPTIPSSAKAIFDALFSTNAHGRLCDLYTDLRSQITKTETAIENSFDTLEKNKEEQFNLTNSKELRASYEKALTTLDNRKKEISKKESDVTKEISTLEKDLKVLNKEVSEKQKKLDETTKKLEAEEAKLQKKQKELNEKRGKKIDLNGQKIQKEDTLNKDKKTLESTKALLDKARIELQQKEGELRQKRSELLTAKAKAKAEAEAEAKKSSKSKKPAPATDTSVLDQKIKELEGETNTLNTQISAYEAQISKLEKSNAQLEREIGDLGKQIQNLDEQIKKLSDEIKKTEGTVIDPLKKRKDQETKELKDAKKRRDTKKCELQAAQSFLYELQNKRKEIDNLTENINKLIKIIDGQCEDIPARLKVLEEERKKIEKNIRTLSRLLIFQKTAQKEFFGHSTSSESFKVNFDNDEMGYVRDFTLNRLREYTNGNRDNNFKNVTNDIKFTLNRRINTLNKKPNSQYDVSELERNVSNALDEIKNSKHASKFLHSFSKSKDTDYKETFKKAADKIDKYIYPTCKKTSEGGFNVEDTIEDGTAAQLKVSDIVSANNAILSNDWGKDYLGDFEKNGIPEEAKPKFAVGDCLRTLRGVHEHGNNYAKEVANVVGYDKPPNGVCNILTKKTSGDKWLANPTPLSVCGLGDLDHLTKLNEALQLLRSSEYDKKNAPDDESIDLYMTLIAPLHPKPKLLPLDEINVYSENTGNQFAAQTCNAKAVKASVCPIETGKFPDKQPFDPNNIYGLDLTQPKKEDDRNKMIVDQGYKKGASSLNNLLKCNIEDKDNVGDRLMSVFAAIGNDPQSFVNQLEEDGGMESLEGIGQLMRGLLTSAKARNLIANQIKTPQDAQTLADNCINFLNKTWFDSPTLRPFNPKEGKDQHILTYDMPRLNALLVCVNSIAEVLTMFGQADKIEAQDKAAIDQIVQNSLENILDSLNKKVLLQNIENNSADDAHKFIAQTILHLACQRSKFLESPANLSTKWHANIIASLAELGATNSSAPDAANALRAVIEFLKFPYGGELGRFLADYISHFTPQDLVQDENDPILSCIGSAAEQIIKKWHQPCENDGRTLVKTLRNRTEINYEDRDSRIQWNPDAKSFTHGTKIVCNLINGASDIIERDNTLGASIKNLVGTNKKLSDEICAFLGISETEALDVIELEKGKFEIKTRSGPHSGEIFYIAQGKEAKNGEISPIFMRSDGMQLIYLEEAPKFHLFKRHFCFVESLSDTSLHYEFVERTGDQDVALSALLRDNRLTFFQGCETDFTHPIDEEKIVKFVNFSDVPILKNLAGDNPPKNLEAIIYQENGTHVIELPAFILHGKPIKLLKKEENGKWILADNPNMELISREEFEKNLNPDSGITTRPQVHNLGGITRSHTDNPMGDRTSGYLVLKQKITKPEDHEKYQFILPEETKYKTEIDKFTASADGITKIKRNEYAPFGSFGKTEPRKLNFNKKELTTQCQELRWDEDAVGRAGEFTTPEVDSKAAMRSLLVFATRALKEKNYAQTIGFLESIPDGLSLSKGEEDESIRNLFFETINDDFDRTPEASALRTRFLLMWLQSDTQADDFLFKKIDTFKPQIITESFSNSLRDQDYYSPRFALSSKQKEALIEKLYQIKIGDISLIPKNGLSTIGKVPASLSLSKLPKVSPASVVTRIYQEPDIMSVGEIKAFDSLREHFSGLNDKPGPKITDESLLDGEPDASKKFTLLGNIQKKTDNMGPIAQSEFARYEEEITAGRRKALEEKQFIPSDDQLNNPEYINKITNAVTANTNTLNKMRNAAHSKLEELYKKIFASKISSETISGKNMMPILIELMLNREKPPLIAQDDIDDNSQIALDFSSKNLRVKMYRKDYNEFLTQARTYLLTNNMLVKNQAIQETIKGIIKLRDEYAKNPRNDAIKIQLQSAYSAMNHDISAQKELCEGEVGENLYGTVANAIGGGITRDELMIYESLSGLRPHVNQAELLKGLFAGDISAFQLIMGGGKTAILISLFCFCVSRRKENEFPVPVILSHPSQFESITGNVAEYQRSRFNQGSVVLDVSRKQLKDVKSLKQILETLNDAKRNKKVIIARTSFLNALQLTFQEICREVNKPDAEGSIREKFEALREILSFFKNYATGIFDEADMNLSVLSEVNFPGGKEKPLSHIQLSSAAELFRYMTDFNERNKSDLFWLSKNEQALQTEKQFNDDLEKLSDHIFDQDIRLDMGLDHPVTWRQFLSNYHISSNDFRKILFGATIPKDKNPFLDSDLVQAKKDREEGKNTKPPSVKELTFDQLATFRGILQTMSYTRHNSANQAYGFTVQEESKIQDGKTITTLKPAFRPYVAVGQPSTNEFGNPYVKLTYYFMHAMHNETIVEGQDTSLIFSKKSGGARLIDLFFDKIQAKINQEKLTTVSGAKLGNDTLERIFKKATGLEFDKFTSALNERNEGRPIQYNQLISAAQKYLSEHVYSRILLFENISEEFIKCHEKMSTSGSMQVASMLGKCVACSGTVWNHKTWPTVLDDKLKQDVGTEGKILIKQKQDFEFGRAHTLISEDDSVRSVLNSLTKHTENLKNFRALIDSGGLFKASNGENVAREMLNWMTEKQIGIEGVMFFRPHEDRAGGNYCIIGRDGTIKVLSSTTKDAIQNVGFKPEQIAVYFDEARTVGTDVKFLPEAFALQTFAPSSTTMRDLLQGVMRMRQLLSSQRVHLVCAQQHLDATLDPNNDKQKNKESFTFEEILEWGTKNQAIKLKTQQMKAYKAKIDAILKDLILGFIQRPHSWGYLKPSDTSKLYNQFIKFFETAVQTDAIELFAKNTVMTDGAKEIERYYEQALISFRQNLKAVKIDERYKGLIEQDLNKSINPSGSLYKEVDAAKKALKGEQFETGETNLDSTVEQDQDQDQEMQQEVEQEQEQEIEQEREQQLEINLQHTPITGGSTCKEVPIDISISDSSSYFGSFKDFQSMSAKDYLRDVQFRATPKKSLGEITNVGQLLPNYIHLSKNYLELVRNDLSPTSPNHKQATYFVLHMKKDGTHECCLISNNEEKFMKDTLDNKDFFIFDMNGTPLGKNQTTEAFSDQIQDSINWIHFLNGDIGPLQSASSLWIDNNLKKRDKNAPNVPSEHESCCSDWLYGCAKFKTLQDEKAGIEPGYAQDKIAKALNNIFQSNKNFEEEARHLYSKLQPKINTLVNITTEQLVLNTIANANAFVQFWVTLLLHISAQLALWTISKRIVTSTYTLDLFDRLDNSAKKDFIESLSKRNVMQAIQNDEFDNEILGNIFETVPEVKLSFDEKIFKEIAAVNQRIADVYKRATSLLHGQSISKRDIINDEQSIPVLVEA